MVEPNGISFIIFLIVIAILYFIGFIIVYFYIKFLFKIIHVKLYIKNYNLCKKEALDLSAMYGGFYILLNMAILFKEGFYEEFQKYSRIDIEYYLIILFSISLYVIYILYICKKNN